MRQKTKQEVCTHLKQGALVDTHRASPASAERKVGVSSGKCTLGRLWKGRYSTFFLLMLKSWQTTTPGPIKIQEKKGGGVKGRKKRKLLKRQQAHPCKNKILFQKVVVKISFSFGKQEEVGMVLGPWDDY